MQIFLAVLPVLPYIQGILATEVNLRPAPLAQEYRSLWRSATQAISSEMRKRGT